METGRALESSTQAVKKTGSQKKKDEARYREEVGKFLDEIEL